MTDRISSLRNDIAKAVAGMKVDVSASRAADRDFIDVRAYHLNDPDYDFESTWTYDGLRWS